MVPSLPITCQELTHITQEATRNMKAPPPKTASHFGPDRTSLAIRWHEAASSTSQLWAPLWKGSTLFTILTVSEALMSETARGSCRIFFLRCPNSLIGYRFYITWLFGHRWDSICCSVLGSEMPWVPISLALIPDAGELFYPYPFPGFWAWWKTLSNNMWFISPALLFVWRHKFGPFK